MYAFLPSGVILASDRQQGLFVLRYTGTHGHLRGTVTVEGSGAPLEGATVRLAESGDSTTTLANGDYLFVAEAGAYEAQVILYGYEAQSVPVVIDSAGMDTLDAALTPFPLGDVAGVVRDAQTNAPIDQATVTVPGSELESLTAADGAYSLAGVVAGTARLDVAAFGYASRRFLVNVDAGGAVEEDLLLPPAILAYDMEAADGWTAGAPGDDATGGIWERDDPFRVAGGTTQPADDHSPLGVDCWITDNPTGNGAGVSDTDVDEGKTTLLSPVLDLASVSAPVVSYWRWWTNTPAGSGGDDPWKVEVRNDGGESWVVVEETLDAAPAWTEVVVHLSDLLAPTSQVQFRFTVADDGIPSTVEALLDDFMVYEGDPLTAVAAGRSPAAATTSLRSAPNPFNPRTVVRYDLASAGEVRLTVVNLAGQQVRTLVEGPAAAGPHEVAWDGRDESGRTLASGVYFSRLEVDGRPLAARKMLLVR